MKKLTYVDLHRGHTFFLIALTIMTFGLLSVSVAPAHAYKYVAQWGSYGNGNGQFWRPLGDAVDSSGNVYVVDDYNQRIQKFNNNGGYITQWGSYGNGNGQFVYPVAAAVDFSGNVYVADSNNHRIQKFDSNGGYITQWGSQGSGNGQFEYSFAVAVDSSGNVYVADLDNHRIQKFDSNGGYITQWGSYGNGNGQFEYPEGVAVDSSGNVYVADNNNHRIQKFDSNGGYITQWGSYGNGNGQFNSPTLVTVDFSGNVYVNDAGNNRIQKFDSNGGYITQWGSYGNGNGQFDEPEGVAVDSFGNVFVADAGNNRIQKFAPTNLTITKTASPTTYSTVNQNLTYTYTVTNSGDVGISAPINVTDNRTGLILISNSDLAPGQSVIGTANYTVTQSDLDNGSVTNDAFASGTFGSSIVTSDHVNTTVTAIQSPALMTVKIASPTTYNAVGQNITYTYTVNNTGNVNILGPINVTDNRTGLVPISNSDLAPGQSVIGTANYTVTQSDLDNGSVTNDAYATGNFGNGIVISNTDTKTVTAIQSPALMTVKIASPTTYNAVGQNITYTYTVNNTGNVNILGPINITDNKTGLVPISNSDLAPGLNVSGTANYTVKQSDINNGSITNSAYATAGSIKSNTVNVTVTSTAVQGPALTITKTANPTTYNSVGQKITYTYTVTNTGNVPVSGIKVTDNKTTVTISSGTLAPGSSFVGTAKYTIKQTDINAGSITNSAYATGTYNKKKVTSNQVTATVTAVQSPALKIKKTADPTTYNSVGQKITYTYTVTNTGNVPVSGIKITDNKTTVTINSGTLAPGSSVTGKGTYTIKQPDINAGSVTNSATATGKFNGNTVTSNQVTVTVKYRKWRS